MALKLEFVLGSTARFWMMREFQYRESLARTEERELLRGEVEWLKKLPLKGMIHFKWIQKFTDKGDQVAECLRFFGVASVKVWQHQYGEPAAAFRASGRYTMQPGAVAAWLRQGERRASELACQPFDKAKFKEVLANTRKLTNETDPEVFVPHLVEVCADAGVAVVFEPAPKGCPASGATRWISPEKALLMLSLRHKTNDQLWFSFFHEAGHLMLHGKRLHFIDFVGSLGDEKEVEADAFASNLLIPVESAEEMSLLSHTNAAVKAFASRVGIAPGIVVGRMQKEKYLPWSHLNGLKVGYRWVYGE